MVDFATLEAWECLRRKSEWGLRWRVMCLLTIRHSISSRTDPAGLSTRRIFCELRSLCAESLQPLEGEAQRRVSTLHLRYKPRPVSLLCPLVMSSLFKNVAPGQWMLHHRGLGQRPCSPARCRPDIHGTRELRKPTPDRRTPGSATRTRGLPNPRLRIHPL